MSLHEPPSTASEGLLGADVPAEVYEAEASFAQQRLWLIHRLSPGQPTYNVPLGLRARGPLDPRALEHALSAVVERHEILRTAFDEEASEPIQLIWSWLPVSIPQADLTALPKPLRETEAAAWLKNEAARPFDLSRPPLWRATLFRIDREEHLLLFNFHHIVTDEWSNGLFLRELLALYADPSSPLPEPALQYADFAAWQRQWLQGTALERRLEVMRRRLEGVPDALPLPTDRPRPAAEDPSGAEHTFSIPQELVPGLREIARESGATLFMVLLAAFEALLFRLTGQGDFAVGSPVANRTRVETEGVLGYFVNTVALRAEMGDDPAFRDHLARVRTVTVEAFAHEDLPFEKLIEDLRPQRRLDRHPLFQVLLSYHRPEPASAPGPGLSLEPVHLATGNSKFDLSLHAAELPDELHGLWEYSAALFDRPTILRLTGQWINLLADAVAHPGRRLSELALLTEPERHQLRTEHNAPQPDRYPVEPLHRQFGRQAERAPDAVAVSGDGFALTYRELADRAGRLASHLRSRFGVGPEHLVGLCADRSPDLLVGILGILEVGGAYLPLDPDYPAERLSYMVSDSGAKVLLAQRRQVGRLPKVDVPVLILEDALEAPAPDLLPIEVDPGGLAYVIYTSGSTGRPKGVGIPHANVARLINATNAWIGFGPEDVWTLFHSFAFDFSVWEIWGALLHGGRLVVVPYDVSRSPEAFLDMLRRERVTVLNQTPSAFGPLTKLATEPLPDLRLVLFGGEALSVRALDPWFERFGDQRPRLVNLYGITETTVHVTWRPLEAGESLPFGSPVGRPIPDQTVHLLDRFGQPAPLGVPGEIYVGGHGNARGYLGRPDLTAERFLPDPFSEERGARLYRSGDLARRLADGQIEFLGRVDQQVKVRGFRIEPGEIEAALAAHPDVREAAVAVRPGVSGEAGDASLAAWFVPRQGTAPTARTLRDFLVARLPSYMVPAAFMELAELPRTASGKIDRRALPAPKTEGGSGHVPPRTPVEELLAGLWSGILRIEAVGAHDNFFDLGGHSLTATGLAFQVRSTFGVELPVRAVFETPTLAELAARIEKLLADGEETGELPPIAPAPRDGDLPLSFAQRRLWFLDQLAQGESPFYNVPVSMSITGDLDAAALEAALEEIARRHESLRTTFRPGPDGEPVQVIHPPGKVQLPRIDLSLLPDPAAEAKRLVRREGARSFDLQRGPLFRPHLFELGGDRWGLLIVHHHAITDGLSVGILLHEMTTLYAAFRQGLPSPLPPLALQYADYAVWQRRWLTGEAFESRLGFWKRQLEGAPPHLEIPRDHPRASLPGHSGGLVSSGLSEEATAALERRAREQRATPFMALLAAYAVLLGRHAGQEDVVIGTPVANRSRAELEGVIGFFVNLLPLRIDLSGEPTFRALLERVRESALGAYAHQDLPFEALVEALQPRRQTGETPFFQAAFSQEEAAEPMDMAGLDVRFPRIDRGVALFDLTLWIARPPGSTTLPLDLNFRTDIFEATTAKRLLDRFQILLESAVADPDAPVASLPLWSEATWHQMTREWNDTTVPAPGTTVARRVLEHATRQPHAVAIEAGDERLTYAELVERAGELAGELCKAGVGPEDLVAVCLERSAALPVAALGVWMSGGAYLPLDPNSPTERLASLLQDAHPKALITRPTLAERLIATDLPTLLLAGGGSLSREAGEGRGGGGSAATEPPPQPSPALTRGRGSLRPPGEEIENGQGQGLAYVIYTSGSTGHPKGVQIEHTGLAQLTAWTYRAFDLVPGDRITQAMSPSFDASVWEIWSCLAAGATLCVPPQEILASPRDLLLWMEHERITRVFLPPLVAGGAMRETPPPGLQLRTLWTGGDRCPEPPASLGFELVNLYGPTEATVMVTAQRVDTPGQPPIGRPLDGATVLLLDRNLHPVPPGAPGEICLGGPGLARGYLGRPDLTAERFIPDPLASGTRLYRTGDLGRFRPDGTLEFLGRVDRQLKVRGFRVEPGEVEAQLARHPAVQEAVVTAEPDAAGTLRLVAWLTRQPGSEGTATELRAFLQERLPEPMIPAAFHELDAFPLTSSGKVDRAALRRPTQETDRSASSDPVESALLGLWREVLEVPRVTLDDNFFDLGGHSFLLARLRTRIQETFGVEPAMMALFDHPTVAALARHLRQLTGMEIAAPETRPAPKPVAVPEERRGREIAVIGMAGRFPGASDLETFWRNLREGVESISFFSDWQPPSPDQPFRVPAGGVLDGVETWDYDLFGYSRREAELMDPQARLFLECAWEALESAGYDTTRYPGRVGVFGGASHHDYLMALAESGRLGPGEGEAAYLGNVPDFLPTRVSYKLGLEGPSFAVQAACSTSLVAVHLAIQSILSGDCDMALAGAAAVTGRQRSGYAYEPDGLASPDGHLRSFDATAAGSVSSDGVGVVVLKRLDAALADGDTVRAVIRGSAVNNDGSGRAGFLVPRTAGRANVLREALERAGVEPGSIGFLEGHGNGTQLGDLIELSALTEAFRGTGKPGSCVVGSVKSNIGYTHGASGVIGLIKAVLALEHREIPPTLHFARPHPEARLEDTPLRIGTRLEPWETRDQPRRAGVSSFGFGGVNAHVVLEEAPALPTQPSNPSWQLLVLSARTEAALEEATDRLADHLRRHPELSLADVAFTLQTGRRAFEHRRIVLCRTLEEAVAALESRADPVAVAAEALPEEARALLLSGERWLSGTEVDWTSFHAGPERRSRVPLPSYPFQRQPCWILG